jgi:hypothetical protein
MGAGIAASPHCAERRIRQISKLSPRGTLSRIPAHQLRRRFPPTTPSEEEPGDLYSSAPAEASLLFRVARPDPKVKADRCSAALLGMILKQRPALPPAIRKPPSAASRDRKIISSGASSRLAPHPLPKELQHCLPRRSDLWSPAAPSCRCRLSDEAGTAVPITVRPCAAFPSRAKRKIWAQACG